MRPETAKALLTEITDTLPPHDVLRSLADIYKAFREPHEKRAYHKKALEEALRFHARCMENAEKEITEETLAYVNAQPSPASFIENKRGPDPDQITIYACPVCCKQYDKAALGKDCQQTGCPGFVATFVSTRPRGGSKEGSSGGPTAHE